MKRPQIWMEIRALSEAIATTLRIFYPDGSSEYLNMNTYYDNGDRFVRVSGDWENSIGNDWHPDMRYGNEPYRDSAEFLGEL